MQADCAKITRMKGTRLTVLYVGHNCTVQNGMMLLQVGSVITVVLLLLCDEVRGEQFDCVRTFTELERSLTKRDSNIESMSDAFYPPNRQVSIAANVYYFFNDGNEPGEDMNVVSYD